MDVVGIEEKEEGRIRPSKCITSGFVCMHPRRSKPVNQPLSGEMIQKNFNPNFLSLSSQPSQHWQHTGIHYSGQHLVQFCNSDLAKHRFVFFERKTSFEGCKIRLKGGFCGGSE
jgi:hypothetical protein